MVRKSIIGWIIGGVLIIVAAIGVAIYIIIKHEKAKKKHCDCRGGG